MERYQIIEKLAESQVDGMSITELEDLAFDYYVEVLGDLDDNELQNRYDKIFS